MKCCKPCSCEFQGLAGNLVVTVVNLALCTSGMQAFCVSLLCYHVLSGMQAFCVSFLCYHVQSLCFELCYDAQAVLLPYKPC